MSGRPDPVSAQLCFRSRDPDETRGAAASLARAVMEDAAGRPGCEGLVIALIGDLGVGKTVFVKGLAEGLGLDSSLVTSPTFVIAHEYGSRAKLHHVDLYRLENAAELETAGFFDLLEQGDVIAVEWGDRFAGELPRDRLDVRLTRPPVEAGSRDRAPESPSELRSFEVAAGGSRAERVLVRWRSGLSEVGVRQDPPGDRG